jgi:hypothetical protein
MTDADEHREIHAMLGRQISELAGQVERGFDNTRQDIAAMHNQFRDSLDHHVETMHGTPEAKPDSSPRLPKPIEKCKAWVVFALELGALGGSCLGILYFLYRAAEAGLFK